MSLQEIMERVNNSMFDGFVTKIKFVNRCTKIEYVNILLNTFLGEQPMSDKRKLHRRVNGTSLCLCESQFFNNVIDFDAISIEYINGLIQLYGTIKDLPDAQLGKLILKCLIASKDIIIND